MLHINIDGELSGLLELKNQRTKVEVEIAEPQDVVYFLKIKDIIDIQLTPISSTVFACLIVASREMIEKPELQVSVISTDGQETVETNSISVTIDAVSIQDKTTDANTIALRDLRYQIALLDKRINEAFGKRIPKQIPEFDSSTIQKGMVLTAIDNNGTVAFVHPFIDNVTTINGKRSIMKEILLDSSDIEVKDETFTVDTAIKQLLTSVTEQSELISDLSSALTSINERVTVLEEALVNFINSQ
jgi:hypothetical protein